jgi:hypothetical protein
MRETAISTTVQQGATKPFDLNRAGVVAMSSATDDGGFMRGTISWRSRLAASAVALLALAGCGSSAKSAVKSLPTVPTVSTVAKTTTTAKPKPKPTLPPTTVAPTTVPHTAPPVTQPPVTQPPATAAPAVAPVTAAPAQNCPNGTYVNSSGNTVCSPYAAPSAPPGATAKCNDGTYSFSQHRSGTCSHHGGVAQWL